MPLHGRTAILLFYVENGACILRLDAIAYLWKQPGTRCVDLPETHEIVRLLRDVLDMLAPGTLLLVDSILPKQQYLGYVGAGNVARYSGRH